MIKTTIYIPIEIKDREFYSKLLLANYLILENFDVVIGRKHELNQLVMYSKPGIYFGIATYDNLKTFYKKLKSRGFKVVVIDEEGLVTHSDSLYSRLKISKNILEIIDIFFLYGDENKKVLNKNFKNFKTKLIVSGNLRFDLLKKENLKYYALEDNIIQNDYKQYILFCSSFGSCNYFDNKVNYTALLVKKNVLKSQIDIENYKNFVNLKKHAWELFIELIKKTASKYKHYKIIIRPHPSENQEIYYKIRSNFNNVEVISKFSIHPWLNNAKLIINHYCTSSMEAFMLKKPVITLRPKLNSKVEKEFPYFFSHVAKNSKDSQKLINEIILNKKKQQFKNFKKFSNYVFNNKKKYSYKIIVKELKKFKFDNGSNLEIKRYYYTLIKLYIQSFLNRIGNTKQYINHKTTGINQYEILNFFQIANTKKITIKKIVNNVYKISG